MLSLAKFLHLSLKFELVNVVQANGIGHHQGGYSPQG